MEINSRAEEMMKGWGAPEGDWAQHVGNGEDKENGWQTTCDAVAVTSDR